MKRQRTKTLQEVLDQTLKDTGLSKGLEILRIHHAWDQLIGETAAKECSQRSFRDGIYSIKVRSSVLRCQLDMQKTVLTGKLNALLSEPLVTEIIIY